MKFVEAVLLVGGAYLIADSFLSSPGATPAPGNAPSSVAPPVAAPVLSPGGPKSTSTGVVPNVFAVPYNVIVKKVAAVTKSGEMYGEYTQNGLGYSGRIPSVNDKPKPAPTPSPPVYKPSTQTTTSSSSSQSRSSSPPVSSKPSKSWISKDKSKSYYGQRVAVSSSGKIAKI